MRLVAESLHYGCESRSRSTAVYGAFDAIELTCQGRLVGRHQVHAGKRASALESDVLSGLRRLDCRARRRACKLEVLRPERLGKLWTHDRPFRRAQWTA